MSKVGACVSLPIGWKVPRKGSLGKETASFIPANPRRGVKFYRQRSPFEVQREHFGSPRSHWRFDVTQCSQDFRRVFGLVIIILINLIHGLVQNIVVYKFPLQPLVMRGQDAVLWVLLSVSSSDSSWIKWLISPRY